MMRTRTAAVVLMLSLFSTATVVSAQDSMMIEKVESAREKRSPDLQALITGPETWTVE